jgi:hypothetical protein
MRMNEDIENGSALDLYDDGNVKIPGNLKVDTLTADNVLIKRNRARYIRVGNIHSTNLYDLFGENKKDKTSEFAVADYWSLIKIRVLDHDGNNILVTKTGISVMKIEGDPYTNTINIGTGAKQNPIYSANENKITNIINGNIYSNPGIPSDNLSISNILGYHGGKGIHQLEIDLVDEYDIACIELYNRYTSITDKQFRTSDGDLKNKNENETSISYDGIPGIGIKVSSRMNGTIVELISADKIINRSIHTGLWTDVYFKQYIL